MWCLDYPTFTLTDQKSFTTLLTLFHRCSPPSTQFPLDSILKREWMNLKGQVNFLQLGCSNPKEELLSFKYSGRVQERIENIQGVKHNIALYLHIWCSIDLVEMLLQLSHTRYFDTIKELFDFPLLNCPEYLLLSLSQTTPWSGHFLKEELNGALFPIFLCTHVNSIVVLEQLWKISPNVVVRSICNLYSVDNQQLNLSRVLDITQEIRESLLKIATCEEHEFTVPLGILAGKRDFLHFDQWVGERIRSAGEKFIRPLLKYIQDNIITPANEDPENMNEERMEQLMERSQLNEERLIIIFENLLHRKNDPQHSIPSLFMDEIYNVYKESIRILPNLLSTPENSDQIEDKANKYFQKVFSGDITIPQIIDLMRTYKQSEDQGQNEIYACMIHNLLDEYRFFHRYPERELKITGELFGSIIQNKVVEGVIEKIALKYVFEAIKRSGKMLKFAVIALEQFHERLNEWPGLIEVPLFNANFKEHYPALAAKIQKVCVWYIIYIYIYIT